MNTRLLHSFVLMIFGANLCCGVASAEEGGTDYAPPFAPESARPIQLAACTIKTDSGFVLMTDNPISAHCGEFDITVSGISKARKQGEDEETTHVVISLRGRQQKTSKAVLRVQDFPAEFVDSAEYADLNGDGKADFILNLSNHGVGLAAENIGTVYLLSTASGYRYLTLSGMANISRHLRFGNSPQAVRVLQRIEGVHALDNKSHTFFVFDLLQFDATAPKGAKLNNSLDARFPFWTLFTYNPSHAETTLLSPATKKSLWQDPLKKTNFGKLAE